MTEYLPPDRLPLDRTLTFICTCCLVLAVLYLLLTIAGQIAARWQ